MFQKIRKIKRSIWEFLQKKKFEIICFYICRAKTIVTGKDVRFKKMPSLMIHKKSKLVIGNNVLINSDDFGYHCNMHSRCKIMMNNPGAYIEVGDNTRIHGTCLHADKRIVIGKNCLIAANCQIFDNNGHDAAYHNVENRINTLGSPQEIIIEDNVWIGVNVVVLPGVRIGNGSIISADSVVGIDIPARVVAGGNPIKILKQF